MSDTRGRTPRISLLVLGALLVAQALYADVALIERPGKRKAEHGRRAGAASTFILSTGSRTLTDAGGLQYFINTDITFSTTSSASGAVSEASYTGAVAATTSAGGTVAMTLNDAFDGYNALCVSTTGATGLCSTADPNYTVYNQNGAATLDASCANRQVLLNEQTIGSLGVSRKIFVPSNDTFARWLNIVTNHGATSQTVSLTTSNNLGSDSNTIVISSSNGNATAELTDTWVSTFQNYVGGISTDPRLGHVLQGPGAATPLASIHFVNGDDNPYWAYTFNLAPGETKIIMNFVTGQPSKAAANAKAAELATLPPNTLQCLSDTERAQVVNFKIEKVVTAQSIIDEVNAFAANGGICRTAVNSLLAKLENAKAKRSSGQCVVAADLYGAFIHEVQAQTGKCITSAAAATLISDAQYLIAHCP